MASNPGILTDWPWKSLGNYKYIILAPLVTHSIYSYIVNEGNKRDFSNLMIFPFMLLRFLHNQIWISVSRYQTAKGFRKIINKSLEFDQVDRESNWDDQIIMNALTFYFANYVIPGANYVPIWRADGIVMTILLHMGPVEFLYYWLHRALHHHYLYSRYHSHHHSSIVTQPITSVIHPFAETMSYFMLFAIPILAVVFTGTASTIGIFGYIFFIDFMNNLGHCNFEIIPKWLFTIFPPLKYLIYTPSFHSLHHTQFRTNYSLFMPLYDYIYNTMDKSTDDLHEASLKKMNYESPTVVHLTHFTTPESIYHLRLGFASFASKPQPNYTWITWILWPFTYFCMAFMWLFGSTFIAESIIFKNVKSQTWVIPRYKFQYFLQWERKNVNDFIEEAILEAEQRGSKVLTLGLLNQGEEFNRYGELYIEKYSKLKVKLVDGSSLAAAIVINSIPKETTQVVFRGKLNKVAKAILTTLSHKGIQIATLFKIECQKLKEQCGINAVYNNEDCHEKIWLVGDNFNEKEQQNAPKGTLFIPFTQFPPNHIRKDCHYQITPAMLAPTSFQNLDSCEDWLPRRAISAWRIAGILHALEDWNMHECGQTIFDINKIWKASLFHGFQPLAFS